MRRVIMIDHIEIYVANLKRSCLFWEWLLVDELGYYVYQKWSAGISFSDGQSYIVFVQASEDYAASGYHRKRIGLNHLAFQVSTRKQVDRLHEKMKQQNMLLLYEDRFPYAGGSHHYALFVEDPDRIKVEVVARERST